MPNDDPSPQEAQNAKEADKAKLVVAEQKKSSSAQKKLPPKISVPTFAVFMQKFSLDLHSPHFAADRYSLNEGDLSPGAKELRKVKAKDVLLQDSFLHRLHGLVRESARLTSERDKVRLVSAKMGRNIKTIGNGQKTIRALQQKIVDLDSQLKEILGWESRAHLQAAIKELIVVEDNLRRSEEMCASFIHSELRRKHDMGFGKKTKYRMSKFTPLPIPIMYNFDLDSLREKGPEQKLWSELDSRLQRRFKSQGKTVSTITRCRVLAAILRAAGQPSPSPSTLNEYLTRPR